MNRHERGELLHGALELLILRTLSDGPMHGFAITERIQEVSDEVLTVDDGSMYPALYRLHGRGWIEAEWGRGKKNRRAKYYRLTPAGRRALKQAAARWSRFSTAVDRVLEPLPGKS